MELRWRREPQSKRSRVLDIARGSAWPESYTDRTLRNTFLDRWRGREAELIQDEGARAAFRAAAARGDISVLPIWAGEAIDLFIDLAPHADLVTTIATQAEVTLQQAQRALG